MSTEYHQHFFPPFFLFYPLSYVQIQCLLSCKISFKITDFCRHMLTFTYSRDLDNSGRCSRNNRTSFIVMSGNLVSNSLGGWVYKHMKENVEIKHIVKWAWLINTVIVLYSMIYISYIKLATCNVHVLEKDPTRTFLSPNFSYTPFLSHLTVT